MMLYAAIADVCRVYYRVRDLVWEGEKVAVRYWQAQKGLEALAPVPEGSDPELIS